MAEDFSRFIIPAVFSVVGIIVTFWTTQFLASLLLVYEPTYGVDLVTAVDGTLMPDITFIVVILLPIFFIEFLILTLPVAFIMLVIARIFRVATYDIDVMRIGQGFDWIRIMKRSVVPALFALSLGELILSLLNGVIFWIPPLTGVPEGSVRQEIASSLHPLLTLLGSLIALTASIAIFSPTWLLNDAGIVTHVKERHLEYRRCPDTEGVGRWYSNLVGGFGILAFPLAMFHRYFYQKFIILGFPLTLQSILVSLGWTIGLPFAVIAFILPLIIMNEIAIRWTGPIMQRIARRFGASDVQFQYVGTVQPLDSQMMSEMENLSDSMDNSDI
ncbi:MAG: hypothetical protein ACFFE2_05075 [Candidatus Thorarchaeota archaeon]